MKNVRDLAGRDDLTWTQPKALKQAFELRAGEDVVGTLEFRNSFGSFATGESADGEWVLTVRDVGPQDVGTLQYWSLGINMPAP